MGVFDRGQLCLIPSQVKPNFSAALDARGFDHRCSINHPGSLHLQTRPFFVPPTTTTADGYLGRLITLPLGHVCGV